MIEHIDISCFGSFRNFVWRNCVRESDGNIAEFKKLNILYGRNYSGKTMLSRIFRGLETGMLPDKIEDPSFSIKTSSGTINQTEIPATHLQIRVYNKDFVDEHLDFLRDAQGNITPFAIVGRENKEIDRQIAQIEEELGSVERRRGLRHELANKRAEMQSRQEARDKAEKNLKGKLTDKARKIKQNHQHDDVNYDIRKINRDIKAIAERSMAVLTEDEQKERKAVLGESSLPDIENPLSFAPLLVTLRETARELLSRKITPSKPIKELLDDAVLQAWVKDGIPHHQDKRETCGFCGQKLPDDLWTKLDEHFSKESGELESAIKTHIQTLIVEKRALQTIVIVGTKDFYWTFQSSFEEAKEALENELENYGGTLDGIMKSLRQRGADIFTQQQISDLSDNTKEIAAQIAAVNALIERNNQKTGSLAQDQNSAREALRLSEVAQFKLDIDLEGEEQEIANLNRQASESEVDFRTFDENVKAKEKRIETLLTQLKDEKKGAEKVNEYLSHHFGHEGLRFEAVEDTVTSAFNFRILRGDEPAYNLSEGECSLVAFCYFAARLEATELEGKPPVIFIDDPVSSLDSNHIFFVFSLIESVIAKARTDSNGEKILGANGKPIYNYEQLFISTHNLEFLRYLKRLSLPKKDHQMFTVVGKEHGSSIQLMPKYLRNYITEFNYLFGEIYTCADPANAATDHQCFYDFGNNLRRFLEAFLFFKFPFSDDKGDHNKRIRMFFSDDASTEPLVQRLTNEYSHLGGIFDRSMEPIDHAEISKMAEFILKKIKKNDRDQFACLLKSIGKPDRFP